MPAERPVPLRSLVEQDRTYRASLIPEHGRRDRTDRSGVTEEGCSCRPSAIRTPGLLAGSAAKAVSRRPHAASSRASANSWAPSSLRMRSADLRTVESMRLRLARPTLGVDPTHNRTFPSYFRLPNFGRSLISPQRLRWAANYRPPPLPEELAIRECPNIKLGSANCCLFGGWHLEHQQRRGRRRTDLPLVVVQRGFGEGGATAHGDQAAGGADRAAGAAEALHE